jgi:hypothetical protein
LSPESHKVLELQDELRDVQQLQSTAYAFAGIRPDFGGDSDDVADQLRNVQQIQATKGAFAAILADGSAVAWVWLR